jgi:hypothetical protein
MTHITTIEQITALQKGYRVTAVQDNINSGQCWMMEGSVGRFAMSMLESGVCVLPDTPHRDYYGSMVPARTQVKAGSTGSVENACKFWQQVEDGDFEAIDGLEETFGRDEESEVA